MLRGRGAAAAPAAAVRPRLEQHALLAMEVVADEAEPDLPQLLLLGELDERAVCAPREADLLALERPRLVVELERRAVGPASLQRRARCANRRAQTAAKSTAAPETAATGQGWSVGRWSTIETH